MDFQVVQGTIDSEKRKLNRQIDGAKQLCYGLRGWLNATDGTGRSYRTTGGDEELNEAIDGLQEYLIAPLEVGIEQLDSLPEPVGANISLPPLRLGPSMEELNEAAEQVEKMEAQMEKMEAAQQKLPEDLRPLVTMMCLGLEQFLDSARQRLRYLQKAMEDSGKLPNLDEANVEAFLPQPPALPGHVPHNWPKPTDPRDSDQ